jgi:hypothetical protein
MQNWFRLQHYPADYLNLVYRYYAAHGIAYICTYYHLDIPNSTLDLDQLDAGSYEIIGNLSGLVWEKIVMLPIYNTEQIQPSFSADERGFGKHDQITALNFPTLYNIQPTSRDFIHFEELPLNDSNAPNVESPMYQVVNFEKATNTFFSFWKLSAKVSWYTKPQLEQNVREVFAFVDYEKQIYQIDTAQSLFKLLEKNSKLGTNKFYRDQVGWYFQEEKVKKCSEQSTNSNKPEDGTVNPVPHPCDCGNNNQIAQNPYDCDVVVSEPAEHIGDFRDD